MRDLKRAHELLDILCKTCIEGRDGVWDCSTEEGRKGFEDMFDLLIDVKQNIGQPKGV